MKASELLARQTRSGAIESQHEGHLVVCTAHGHALVSRGDRNALVFARSTLKPVQALPLLMDGAAKAFALPDACLAVAMASHGGEAEHRAAVSELLARAGCREAQLQCGTHAPLHGPTAAALLRDGMLPDVLHCNCSGKHAGMLAVCRHAGWDMATYREPEHPLQRRIRTLLAQLSGVREEVFGHGIDGCGVPVWRLPIGALALVFARLTTPDVLPEPLQSAVRRAMAIMAAHPHLIGGTGRLDSDLIAAGRGNWIAKIGGEGVHAGGKIGADLGWALKIADGNKRAIGPSLARALAAAGHPLPEDSLLAPHLCPTVKNNHGEVVGRIVAGW